MVSKKSKVARAHTYPGVSPGGYLFLLSPQEQSNELKPSATFCLAPAESPRGNEDETPAEQDLDQADELPVSDNTATVPDQGTEEVDASDGRARATRALERGIRFTVNTRSGADIFYIQPSERETKEAEKAIKRILPPGTSLAWSFRKGTLLGEGNFGEVRSCHFGGRLVALKKMTKYQEKSYDIACEVSIMDSLDHPNVIGLVKVSRYHDSVYVAVEFMDAGDALKIGTGQGLGDMPEHLLAALTSQVAQGIAYIHSMGYIHCDIKPENILLSTDGEVKISDFGMSLSFLDNQVCLRGTSAYMAPEVFNDGMNGPPSDVWSLGVAAIVWLTGEMPFSGSHDEIKTQVNCLSTHPENLILPKGISGDLQEFLKLALAFSAPLRPPAVFLLGTPFLRNAPPASTLIPRICAKTKL